MYESNVTSRRILLPAMLLLALVTALQSPAAAGEAEKPSAKKKVVSPLLEASRRSRSAASAGRGKVYTNDDLGTPEAASEAESTSPAPAPATGAAQPLDPPQDPIEWMEARKARSAEKTRLIAEAEAQVGAAEKRITALETRIRSVRNPLLAPPSRPEEGGEAWDKQSGVERLNSSEKELEQARKDLEDARAELARVRSLP